MRKKAILALLAGALMLPDYSALARTVDLTEGGLVVTPDENSRRAEAFRKMLAQVPDNGKNNFLITHSPI